MYCPQPLRSKPSLKVSTSSTHHTCNLPQHTAQIGIIISIMLRLHNRPMSNIMQAAEPCQHFSIIRCLQQSALSQCQTCQTTMMPRGTWHACRTQNSYSLQTTPHNTQGRSNNLLYWISTALNQSRTEHIQHCDCCLNHSFIIAQPSTSQEPSTYSTVTAA
jgi:hypothetical protein